MPQQSPAQQRAKAFPDRQHDDFTYIIVYALHKQLCRVILILTNFDFSKHFFYLCRRKLKINHLLCI